MKVLTIIQARLASTRLPGKVLLPLAGKTMLKHVVDATPFPRIVAIPDNEPELECYCQTSGMEYAMGPPDDVLHRFIVAYRHSPWEADAILRVTADCPLLTPTLIANFLSQCIGLTDNQIATNRPSDPDGFDLELFTPATLYRTHECATTPRDREHVTTWMYDNLTTIRIPQLTIPDKPLNIKLSIDTMDEYNAIKLLMGGKK